MLSCGSYFEWSTDPSRMPCKPAARWGVCFLEAKRAEPESFLKGLDQRISIMWSLTILRLKGKFSERWVIDCSVSMGVKTQNKCIFLRLKKKKKSCLGHPKVYSGSPSVVLFFYFNFYFILEYSGFTVSG